MRFVFAIIAFVVAAASIGYGIAQRTVLAPAERITTAIETAGDAPFTVIDGTVFNSSPGQQRLSLAGGDGVFAAYARTADLMAWLSDEPYNDVTIAPDTLALSSEVVSNEPAEGTPATSPESAELPAAPIGSDLWLDERQEESSLVWTVSIPDDVSVIIASDGTQPAPSDVRLSWPQEYSTPWAGPLIIGGGILLLVGLALYIWGLVHMRRTRGPRRKAPPKLPTPPRPRNTRAPALEPATTAKGRRSARRVAATFGAAGLAVSLLAGCTDLGVDELFEDAPAPVPTTSSTILPETEVVPVAVTEGQLRRIIERASATIGQADAERNGDLLRTRMSSPALDQRLAAYTIQSAGQAVAAPAAIPATPIAISLPEATAAWPRTVLAVVGGDDPAVAPIAVVLVQNSPRENYLVSYSVPLQANVPFPKVAPAAVGATSVPKDNKLLSVRPDEVGPQYADILLQGPASPFFNRFQAEPDRLRLDIGVDKKNEAKASFPSTGVLEYSNGVGAGDTRALATSDSGALVVTSMVERATARPVEADAEVGTGAEAKALSGITTSKTGIESTYSLQLLFYVPSGTDDGQVVLLGYAQALTGVREL